MKRPETPSRDDSGLTESPQWVIPRSADEFVEGGFQELLATRLEPGDITQGQRVLLAIGEGSLARLDLGADAGVPGAIAVLDEGVDAAVFADGGGDLQWGAGLVATARAALRSGVS